MKKFAHSRKRAIPFTVANIEKALLKVIGEKPKSLTVKLPDKKEGAVCDVDLELDGGERQHNVIGFVVWKDITSLNEDTAENLPYQDELGFFKIGSLSSEEILRLVSKCWGASGLKPWVVSDDRDVGLSGDEIRARLDNPLEIFISTYKKSGDWEEALSVYDEYCHPDPEVVGRRIVYQLGGAHKVWTEDLYVELPGGFIALIYELPNGVERFRELVARSGHGRILT